MNSAQSGLKSSSSMETVAAITKAATNTAVAVPNNILDSADLTHHRLPSDQDPLMGKDNPKLEAFDEDEEEREMMSGLGNESGTSPSPSPRTNCKFYPAKLAEVEELEEDGASSVSKSPDKVRFDDTVQIDGGKDVTKLNGNETSNGVNGVSPSLLVTVGGSGDPLHKDATWDYLHTFKLI